MSEKKSISRYLPDNNTQNLIFNLNQKKPILPSAEEIEENPPSRSAKLRYAKKIIDIYDFETNIINEFSNLLEIEKLGDNLWKNFGQSL